MSALMPKCYRPIKFSNEPKNNAGYWDRAFEFYEAGQYRNSLLDTINYINPNILKGKDLDAEITSNQPHGSAVIALKITNDEFSISAPFLKTTNANKVALMRRVCEVNFSDLTLTQIFLKNDSLWFYFKSPLKLCHPTKIYDVIREVCVYADDYDDEFIQQYNADYFIKPKITQLSTQQQEKVWSDFQEIAKQYREYLGEFEQKRWLGSVWDIMAITMLNVSNMPYVHGTLRTDLERAIGMHYDGNLDGNYRIDQTKAYLNKLFNNTPKETFLTNIYQVKKLFSVRYRCTTEILMRPFGAFPSGFRMTLTPQMHSK